MSEKSDLTKTGSPARRSAEMLSPEGVERAITRLRPAERMEFEALMQALNDFPTFERYLRDHDPHFKWYDVTHRVAAVCQRVLDGDIKRLIINWPSRHGKTESVTLRVPAVNLRRNPELMNATLAYSDSMANRHSRKTKQLYRLYGGEVKRGVDQVREWETPQGGGLWAAGPGGESLGKGVSGIMVFDDPFKSAKQAYSAVFRESVFEWYQLMYSRLEQDAGLIIVHQRLHEKDLTGEIMARAMQVDADGQEPWHIMRLPAIADLDTLRLPPMWTQEAEWREKGEALIPERYTAQALRRIMAAVGPYLAAAMYQQKPIARAGRMFKFPWFVYVKQRPAIVKARVRYWDLAGTEEGGDCTAGALISRTIHDSYYIEDVAAGNWGVERRGDEMVKVGERDLRTCRDAPLVWWIESDSGQGGKERTKALVRKLQGIGLTVRSENPGGLQSKILRADPIAAAMGEDNVRLVEGPWNAPFRDEALEFPSGGHDDRVDAASGAYNKLTDQGEWDSGTYGVR